MSRLTLPTHPLMLGFENLERLIERTAKSPGEGYPPYNIERIGEQDGQAPEMLRITLAVAGFSRDQLEILLEDKQLTIRGKQVDETPRNYIHRGIAARQFIRTFVLAEGLEVHGANLDHGLLTIDLVRLVPTKLVKTISIGNKNS